MKILFDAKRLPRNMTREQWRTLYHYKRVRERIAQLHEDGMRAFLRNDVSRAVMFGNAIERLTVDLVCPPVLVIC